MATLNGHLVAVTWHQDQYSDICRARSGSRGVGTVVQDRINDDPEAFIWLSAVDRAQGRSASLEEAKRQVEMAWRASSSFDPDR